MMLGHNEAAGRSQLYLRIVREDPRAGRDHVAFQSQRGFVDLVPDRKRDAGLIFCFSGSPASKQIFVVDKESAVLEYRSREGSVQRQRNLYRGPTGGLAVGPIIKGIDAEELLGEFVNRIHGPANVRSA